MTDYIACKSCGAFVSRPWNYCPTCGVKWKATVRTINPYPFEYPLEPTVEYRCTGCGAHEVHGGGLASTRDVQECLMDETGCVIYVCTGDRLYDAKYCPDCGAPVERIESD